MKKILKIIVLSLLGFFISVAFIACKKDPTEKDDPPITDELNAVYGDKEVTQTKVVMYDGPKILTSSEIADVKVNDKDLFLYETRVNHGRVFTYSPADIEYVPVGVFDFEGKVTISVQIKDTIVTEAIVTPQTYKIKTDIKDNIITFDLSYPGNYTIEWNNQSNKVIHLFANEIEEDPISEDNIPNNVVYIGPGVYKADTIALKSNQTLYIAGGAVVYGKISLGNLENITIRGRGIISGEIYSRTKDSEFTVPFDVQNSNGVIVKDILFLDSAGWTLNCYFLTNLTIDNVKIITARANGDGISLQSCRDVIVKNCFVRSWDDSIVVKNYNLGTTKNVTIENCTIWTDLAQSMEVGYECYGASIEDVTFKNITVLHNFHKAAISIHNSDQAKISNIKFENITIEDAQMQGDYATEINDNYFIDFRILYSTSWTKSGGERGTIDNVTVNNVKVLKGNDDMNILIQGYDATHRITNVTISNVLYKDKKVTNDEVINTFKNEYISDVSYSFTECSGVLLSLPYKLNLVNNDVNYEIKENVEQIGFLVPDFSIAEIQSTYMGVMVKGNFETNVTHGISASVYDDKSGDYESKDHPASNLVDSNNKTYFEAIPWNNSITNDYVTVTIKFDEVKKLGTIRIWSDPDSKSYFVQNIAIYGVKEGKTSFSKVASAVDLEFSPASGNFVDIKINPGAFTSIQLRIYHKDGNFYSKTARLYEIEFYPASLTYGKVITGTEHEDVYKITNIVDGAPNTYYEGLRGVFPADIQIDMKETYGIKYITFQLPPQMAWSARTEVVNIYVGILEGEDIKFSELYKNLSLNFDPKVGNVIELVLDEPVKCQYFKIEVLSSSSGYGAQFSEISIFE